jgi:hypothetical protein
VNAGADPKVAPHSGEHAGQPPCQIAGQDSPVGAIVCR